MANGTVLSCSGCLTEDISKAALTTLKVSKLSLPMRPGLKVVIPSNAADAKRLLKAAIRDPNPVVFFEHKALYRQRVFCARKEPTEEELLPLGKAKVVREGSDVTVVCWGMMVFMAAQVAETLSKEGISVEVIDLRTIVPFDVETVLQSRQKNGQTPRRS